MSLLNAWVEPSRAVIATDTATHSQRGTSRSHMSKMLALPHLSAVVATIGNTDMCAVFMYTLADIGCDFDGFLADADNLVNNSVRYYESKVGAGMRDAQAVAVIGWSRARNRAVGIYGEREKRGQALIVREIEGTLVCPGWPEYTHRELSTDSAMLEAATSQVAHVTRVAPDCPIGGRLLVAEISARGITLRDTGSL